MADTLSRTIADIDVTADASAVGDCVTADCDRFVDRLVDGDVTVVLADGTVSPRFGTVPLTPLRLGAGDVETELAPGAVDLVTGKLETSGDTTADGETAENVREGASLFGDGDTSWTVATRDEVNTGGVGTLGPPVAVTPPPTAVLLTPGDRVSFPRVRSDCSCSTIFCSVSGSDADVVDVLSADIRELPFSVEEGVDAFRTASNAEVLVKLLFKLFCNDVHVLIVALMLAVAALRLGGKVVVDLCSPVSA